MKPDYEKQMFEDPEILQWVSMAKTWLGIQCHPRDAPQNVEQQWKGEGSESHHFFLLHDRRSSLQDHLQQTSR